MSLFLVLHNGLRFRFNHIEITETELFLNFLMFMESFLMSDEFEICKYNSLKWIDPTKRKPEGEVFWALTQGRNEQGVCDWAIIRLWNCDLGDYRSLDVGQAYRVKGIYIGQSWYNTLHAWLPLEAIPINDTEWL